MGSLGTKWKKGGPRGTFRNIFSIPLAVGMFGEKKAIFICQNPHLTGYFFSQLIDSDTQELLSWPYHWLDLASMYWALLMDKAKRTRGAIALGNRFVQGLIASHYKLPPEPKNLTAP